MTAARGVRIEAACVSVRGSSWVYVHARGVGGVGRTLSPRKARRCANDARYLLRVWADLCGVLRKSQRRAWGRHGFGCCEV